MAVGPKSVGVSEQGAGHLSNWLDSALTLGAPLIWLIPLELIAQVGLLDRRFFLFPSQAADGLIEGLRDGWLVPHLSVTVQRLFIGYLVGVILAIPMVLLTQRFRLARAVFGPAAATAALASTMAVIPLAILVFGLGEASKWAITGLSTFWTLLLGLGLLNGLLPPPSSLQPDGPVRRVHDGFSVLKLALASSLMSLTAMELVGSKSGLGYVLWQGWSSFRPEPMYVGMLTIFLVAYLSYLLLTALEGLVLRWARRGVVPGDLPAAAEEPARAG